MKASACIDAPIEKTWKILSDLKKTSDWSEEILSTSCTGDVKKGLNAERECTLKGNIRIVERILSWYERESFSYKGSIFQ